MLSSVVQRLIRHAFFLSLFAKDLQAQPSHDPYHNIWEREPSVKQNCARFRFRREHDTSTRSIGRRKSLRSISCSAAPGKAIFTCFSNLFQGLDDRLRCQRKIENPDTLQGITDGVCKSRCDGNTGRLPNAFGTKRPDAVSRL